MGSSGHKLLEESRELFARARETLSATPAAQGEQPTQHSQHSTQENRTMSEVNINGLTPQVAARLYNEGKSVIEVAREYNTTYAKVRKLLKAENVEIRNASARLKGRPRTKASE
jgi:hypothetical protein